LFVVGSRRLVKLSRSAPIRNPHASAAKDKRSEIGFYRIIATQICRRNRELARLVCVLQARMPNEVWPAAGRDISLRIESPIAFLRGLQVCGEPQMMQLQRELLWFPLIPSHGPPRIERSLSPIYIASCH
jgi:hypothetical protein